MTGGDVHAEAEIIGQPTFTVQDDRFYRVDGKVYPRITWILSYYPKTIEFYKWLAAQGWEAAENKKNAAADAGSTIHAAAQRLLLGETLRYEQFTVEEWAKVRNFADWYHEFAPDRVVGIEQLVVSKIHNYAGTFDMLLEKDGKTYLIDLKTGKGVYPSYWMQLAAYRQGYREKTGRDVDVLAILHVGTKHKCGYNMLKLTGVERMDHEFDLFLCAKKIFHNELGDSPEPADHTAPQALKLALPQSKQPNSTII